MAQKLKEDVRESIIKAALDCFFEKSFQDTTLLDISSRANIAVGNLYRYFADKEAIFYAAVPEIPIIRVRMTLKENFRLSHGKEVCLAGVFGESMQEDLVNLISENRKFWYIVLWKSGGTKYSGFKDEIITFLTTLYLQYCESLPQAEFQNEDLRDLDFLIRQVYRTLIDSFCAALREYDDVLIIKKQCRKILSFHFAGMNALFQKEGGVK